MKTLIKYFLLGFITLIGCSCEAPEEMPTTDYENVLGVTFQTFKESTPQGNVIIFGGWVTNPTQEEINGNIVFETEQGIEYVPVHMEPGSVGGTFTAECQYYYETTTAIIDTVYFDKL